MVDRYTKSVLTVIAAALVTLSAQGFIRTARATDGGDAVQKVAICATHGTVCADILSLPVGPGETLKRNALSTTAAD